MPIGFWAINRKQLRDMVRTRTGVSITKWYMDILVEKLTEELEKTLDLLIEFAVKEIKDELAR
uniref:Uncharacterized protein n=1 Tax=viral metagenome TaxID=1070528 RepID=A0A6M3XT44_9ZZZZ